MADKTYNETLDDLSGVTIQDAITDGVFPDPLTPVQQKSLRADLKQALRVTIDTFLCKAEMEG